MPPAALRPLCRRPDRRVLARAAGPAENRTVIPNRVSAGGVGEDTPKPISASGYLQKGLFPKRLAPDKKSRE